MRIFRISNVLFLMLATMCGVSLFWTSQAVQQKEEELAGVRENLVHEQETLRVLSVEWDYLNRPQRLEKLAAEQLGMELPSAGEMVRGVDEIPEPVLADSDVDIDGQGGLIQPAALTTAMARPQAEIKKETVAPSRAEKQSFEKLISSLSTEGQ